MDKCGATIAFEYFTSKLNSNLFSELGTNNPLESTQNERMFLVPQQDLPRISCIFEYIEDADLWKWKLPNSKAFTSGLSSLKFDYNINSNPQLFNKVTYFELGNCLY